MKRCLATSLDIYHFIHLELRRDRVIREKRIVNSVGQETMYSQVETFSFIKIVYSGFVELRGR